MQFISIKLCKYKRLSLNNIDYLEINPKNKIQLILGSNSSGKSSTLSQITPLPANHQDYLKDGYKIVEILHNNSHYELKSIFASTGNRYNFIKDGIELNDGLTASTFKELVKQEFKITQDIQDVLSGVTTFTEMTVSDRRNWFTKISDADYTYAIKYFSKLKEQHRDMLGAIKIQQSRLVQESEKLLTPEQDEKYRFEIKLFNEYLTHLLDQKTPVNKQSDKLLIEIKDLESSLIKLTDSFRSSYKVFNNKENLTGPEDIDAIIIEQKSKELSLVTRIEKLCLTIEEQDGILQSLKDNNLTSLADIDSSIDLHLKSIAELQGYDRLGLQFEDPQSAYNSLITVSDNLNRISEELLENKDRDITRDKYIEALERQKALRDSLIDIDNNLSILEAKRKELEHFKEHNQIKCPKCTHVWHQGFEEFQYKITLDSIEVTKLSREQYVEALNTKSALVDTMRNYLELYKEYVNVTKAWVILEPLWNLINDTSVIFEDPRRITQLVETLKGDLLVSVKLQNTKRLLNESVAIKKSFENAQENSVSSLVTHSEELHELLYNLNTDLRKTRTSIAQYVGYKDTLKKMELLTSSMQAALTERVSKTDDLVNAMKMQALNDAIELVKTQLFDREQIISKIDTQFAIVMDIQLNIQTLSNKAELLKIAIDELSPSQGLIAKGLTGFINHFVGQINVFIKNVWLWPMELVAIVPDKDDGVDLDYKFSVIVNDNSQNVIPDVTKGSAGMREIINLAFKVVSMMFLGLDKAPLVLDEFGANLDTAHRNSAQYAITNLINASDFSQIFMVSHYENAYGSLKNSDVCVLHPANIIIPRDMIYNQHVKMS